MASLTHSCNIASGECGAADSPRCDHSSGDLDCDEVTGFNGNIGESHKRIGVTTATLKIEKM